MVLSPDWNPICATCDNGMSAPELEVSNSLPIACGLLRVAAGKRTVVS